MTLIAVLVILVGVIGLLFSLAIFALSALATNFGGASVGTVGTVIGGIFLFFSLIYLLVGRGFLGGKGWAWTLGIIFSILSLVGSVGAIAVGQPGGVGGPLIWGLVVYYLTRPRVKSILWQRRTTDHSIISAYATVRAASNDDQLSRLHPASNEPFKPYLRTSSPGRVYAAISYRIRVLFVLGSAFFQFYPWNPGNTQLSQLWKQTRHRAEQMPRVRRKYLARLHGPNHLE